MWNSYHKCDALADGKYSTEKTAVKNSSVVKRKVLSTSYFKIQLFRTVKNKMMKAVDNCKSLNTVSKNRQGETMI